MNPILIVDDNEQIVEILTRYIRAQGWPVLSARSGEEALSLFDAAAPAMILLDILLPGIDGLEVCRRIRRVSGVPILMITARDEDADRNLGLDIGADDYIVKPFDAKEVTARIKAVLRRSSAKEEEREQHEKSFIQPFDPHNARRYAALLPDRHCIRRRTGKRFRCG